ncbi:hypothetical protein Q7O_003699 [Pectobacterium carotovorum subsp. carotovorum PCCS1]|nr:hypothetical protein [Pectobacterium carotovorum subsp. carotovorum PCCS1]
MFISSTSLLCQNRLLPCLNFRLKMKEHYLYFRPMDFRLC